MSAKTRYRVWRFETLPQSPPGTVEGEGRIDGDEFITEWKEARGPDGERGTFRNRMRMDGPDVLVIRSEVEPEGGALVTLGVWGFQRVPSPPDGAGGLPSRPQTSQPIASLRAVADSVAEAYASSDRWHGGLLVASGESVIYRGAVGSADRATGALNTPEMRYDIYSISKPFTAIVVLQLVESGDLSLDGTLAEYLPDYPGPAADRITIHHLPSHTSGVPDYIMAMLPGYFDAPPRLPAQSRPR